MAPVFFLSIIFILPLLCVGSEDEIRLLKNLTSVSYKLERPAKNNKDIVTVKFGIILQQLINVDEVTQSLTALTWFKVTWNDYKLTWDPEDFGGITDVRLPINEIWKPDVSLYNSVDGNVEATFHTDAVIYSDGTVNWIPPKKQIISCKMDLYRFPYDKQLCYFKFGSWTYNGIQLDLQPDGFDISEYLPNDEWMLTETIVKRSEKFYDCCPEPYPSLKFSMKISRRSSYYFWAIVLPALLLTILSIIGFLLPPPKMEKLFFEGLLLIAYFILYGSLLEIIPSTASNVPVLATYCFGMIVLLVVVLFSIFATSMQGRPHKMSKITRVIFVNILGRLMCLGQLPRSIYEKEMFLLSSSDQEKTDPNPVVQAIEKVRMDIKKLGKQLQQSNEEDDRKKEWRFAAAAVDRLCFVLLIIMIIFCVVRFSLCDRYTW